MFQTVLHGHLHSCIWTLKGTSVVLGTRLRGPAVPVPWLGLNRVWLRSHETRIHNPEIFLCLFVYLYRDTGTQENKIHPQVTPQVGSLIGKFIASILLLLPWHAAGKLRHADLVSGWQPDQGIILQSLILATTYVKQVGFHQ